MERVYAHFIGVGGAGMSAIARVLHERGVPITGSDLKRSGYTDQLEDLGIPIAIGHAPEHLGSPEVVVVSTAIPDSNPELAAARAGGIPVWPRARMLAELAGDSATVAVAGTHGKTTTSSMVTAALRAAGRDPTFLIGGELNDVGANAGCGDGPHYVVEADESDGSFLYLSPHTALITNVEADHLDHYSNLREVEEAFLEFMSRCDEDGRLVVCVDDPPLARLCEGVERIQGPRILTYGSSEMAEVRITDVVARRSGHDFTVTFPDGSSVRTRLPVPGMHNVINACGALAAVWSLGVDPAAAAAGLERFTGVRRRMELVGEADGVRVIDDYAHHPTEVRATIAAALEANEGRLWVVFQPHRYSRTAAIGDDFGDAFEQADRVVLMDVYSAGEAPIPGVSGRTLLKAVLDMVPHSRVAYLPHRADVEPYVLQGIRPGDTVMTMGAGDVTSLGPMITDALRRRLEASVG